MRKLYTSLLYCAIPFLLLRLLWRSLQDPSYRKRWRERFGYVANPPKQCDILIHAVSVGEVVTAILLIKRLLDQDKTKKIVVTTTTPTGSARVQKNLGKAVFHVYMPYDYPNAIRRFFQSLNPKLAIIMETELWPNLLFYCSQNQIPVLLANARLSERSVRGYQKIKPLVSGMLHHIDLIVVQGSADAKRFISLGANPSKITVSGNIKFDIVIAPELQNKGSALRQKWDPQRPVWIAASTHEGEDEQILQAFSRVRQQVPEVVLILVPRHPWRFKKVAALCHENGFTTLLRTAPDQSLNKVDILIGNTMGELLLLYAAADVAFVGGSLVRHGGHNILEPAALAMPIISGPHVFNFALINQLFEAENAIYSISDWQSLANAVVKLLKNPTLSHQMGEKAKQIVVQNRGSIERHLEFINQLLIANVSKQ